MLWARHCQASYPILGQVLLPKETSFVTHSLLPWSTVTKGVKKVNDLQFSSRVDPHDKGGKNENILIYKKLIAKNIS